ncbi:MAG: DUF1788 domain-containing protein [Verrucomicrobia bacterium]|nr:DUF1788 domain-containing protein [Verrucomicrobiota bacterium]MCH8511652.1 DUF1788 domain-containing protein [Kiritimatiellia bacterium]
MNRIETLAKKFDQHISLPWQQQLTDTEKTIFLVYPKEEERRLRAQKDLFRQSSQSAGHPWEEICLDDMFPDWMAEQEYAYDYFEYPSDVRQKLETEFRDAVAARLRDKLASMGADAVLAVFGVGTLFGHCHVSAILESLHGSVNGRLVVFFPGSHERNVYHLLDARDGWGYLASPITLTEESYL